jgi:hypothetical protein
MARFSSVYLDLRQEIDDLSPGENPGIHSLPKSERERRSKRQPRPFRRNLASAQIGLFNTWPDGRPREFNQDKLLTKQLSDHEDGHSDDRNDAANGRYCCNDSHKTSYAK